MNIFQNHNDGRLIDRLNLPTPQTSGKLRSQQLRRRYGTELLGALLFVAAIVAFNSYDHGTNSQAAKTQGSAAHSTTLNVQTTPADNQGSAAQSGSTSMSKEDTTMSDSTSSDVTAKVTVNGVDIPVPVNGTTEQTVASGAGNTSVTISSDQSTTGNAKGTNHILSHLHVSTTTRSNDSSTESWSETP